MTEPLSARDLGPCPVCGQTLSRPIAACSRCHTPHHADCWSYNEGCAIFACGTKPAAPPPPSAASRILPRLTLPAIFMVLCAVFALHGRSINVRVEDLGVSSEGRGPAASWMTTPRARCVIEVVRANEPEVVLYRRHTPRSHHHRVPLPFIKAGETYLVRVASQSGLFAGETISQLYRAPDEPPSRPQAAQALDLPRAFSQPFPYPVPESAARRRFGDPRGRDPFRLPEHSVQMRIRPDVQRSPFSAFDLRLGSLDAHMTWRTRQPLLFCRALLMRDATLKGVEKVVDATSRLGGHFHRVSLDGLEADTSYQLLVLGFPASGDPVQSPVLSFRTLR